jgi:hypothetical protein
MKEFLIGMSGAIIGAILFMLGNMAFYLYETKRRQKAVKDFERNVLEAIKLQGQPTPTSSGPGAKIFPFNKNPNPPKIN